MRRGIAMFALGSMLILPGAFAELGLPYVTSFEEGPDLPSDWTTASEANSGARWESGDARRGARALSGQTQEPSALWLGPEVRLGKDFGEICEGWIKAPSGEGWLDVVLRDEAGETLARLSSAHVKQRGEWTYVAVDTSTAVGLARPAATLRMEFWVKEGTAYLDDVRSTSSSPTPMGNSDYEADLDRKSRVPFWNAEENANLVDGVSAGALTLDAEEPIEGAKSLLVTATGDWTGATTVAYPVPTWTDGLEFRVTARCAPGTQVQCVTVWVDPAQEVIQIDKGAMASSSEASELTSGRLTPPEGAQSVRPVFVVRKSEGTAEAKAWFDGARMVARPERRQAVVLTNQVGYESKGPKRAVVMTNFAPSNVVEGKLTLQGEQGPVLDVPLTCSGRMYGQDGADWGWYFWRGDFSSLTTDGKYTARANIDGAEDESYPFEIAKDRIFSVLTPLDVDFFFVQRCGFEVPGWHGLCHMDDAKMQDGTHLDLTGGWHSAGDYNKIVYEWGDGGAMYGLVEAYRLAPESLNALDRNADGIPDALDEAWWGAKFMAKMQRTDTNGLINTIHQGPARTWMKWVAPEQTSDNKPGTEDDPEVQPGDGNSPLTIGGWARLGAILTQRGTNNDYLDRAIRLWKQATENGTKNESPLLLISTVDLLDVTKDNQFLDYARRTVDVLLASQTPDGRIPGGNSDSGDIPSAALAHFALTRPDEPAVPRIREALAKHIPHLINEPDNPLGITRQKRDPDGFYFEPTSTLGHNWEFFSRAWGAFNIYRLLGDRDVLAYGLDQINFVLGMNPYSLCMMEGAGTVNPPRYHHRYNAIPGKERGAVPGAIPNGFVRDMSGNDRPGFDLSTAGRQAPSYRTSEPWLVHNVLAQLALNALHEAQKNF